MEQKCKKVEEARAVLGKYNHNVDAKGRLFVPAKLREELGEVFYVTVGLDNCLSVYPTARWKRIEENYSQLPLSKTRMLRTLFANACRCEPDKQGRFLVPQELRTYAGITDEVTFVGLGDHAEIWSAGRFAALEAQELNSEKLLQAMEELQF